MGMTTPRRVLVMNGPNLNLLGTRQPELYGSDTLADVAVLVQERAADLDVEVEFFQSNHEGQLVDRLHAARGAVAGVVVNAGAFTHTSLALRDAFLAAELSLVEVHVTNVHAREAFRHHSYLSDIAQAVVAGAGIHGYVYGLEILARRWDQSVVRSAH